jgi:TatD DNase family protein
MKTQRRKKKPLPAKKKNKPAARKGGCCMGVTMFDIGVNLTSSQFDRDRDEVVTRAFATEISGMLITGTNLQESEAAQQLAQRYEHCWSTAGVHPHDSSSWTVEVAEAIRQLAQQPRVVAIGECGLDFNRNFSTPQEQEIAFSAQLSLAAELNMPVFLHCRDAHERFITLLKPWLSKLPGAVLHCFTGTRQELEECLANGLYIGITGWVCDERRGLELRELLPLIPADRLLVETDAPWLLPRDLSPKPASRRNEPKNLPHILTQIAQWRGEDLQTLSAITDQNVKAVFGVDF